MARPQGGAREPAFEHLLDMYDHRKLGEHDANLAETLAGELMGTDAEHNRLCRTSDCHGR